MWSAIGLVTGVFTLIAYIIAAGLYAYRLRLKTDLEALGKAPQSERAKIIRKQRPIDTARTSSTSVAGTDAAIILDIRREIEKDRLKAITVLGLAILLTIILVVAITQHYTERGAGVSSTVPSNQHVADTVPSRPQTVPTPSVPPPVSNECVAAVLKTFNLGTVTAKHGYGSVSGVLNDVTVSIVRGCNDGKPAETLSLKYGYYAGSGSMSQHGNQSLKVRLFAADGSWLTDIPFGVDRGNCRHGSPEARSYVAILNGIGSLIAKAEVEVGPVTGTIDPC